METRRDIFQALADPTRRAIILLLAAKAMTPNSLASHFEHSRQAVSKHIQVLAECELVSQEYHGREIYYKLDANKLVEVEKWLDQLHKLLSTRFSQLDELLKQAKRQKKG